MTKETPAEYAARHRAEAASSRPVRIAALKQDLTASVPQRQSSATKSWHAGRDSLP